MSDAGCHGCGSCGPRTDGCFVSCEMTQQARREKGDMGVNPQNYLDERRACNMRCNAYRQKCETALCGYPSEVHATGTYLMKAKGQKSLGAQKKSRTKSQTKFRTKGPVPNYFKRLNRAVFRNQLTEHVVDDCDETPSWCYEPACEEREPTPPCTPCLSPPAPRHPPPSCSSFGYDYAQARKPGISSANDYSPSCFVPRPCRG